GFAGPFIFGMAVAKTVGHDMVIPEFITTRVLIIALVSASAWNIITWTSGIPSSSSHALVGGIIGAVIVSAGFKALVWRGFIVIGAALLLSPLAGLFFGWLTMKLIYRLVRNATPRANYFFKFGQLPTTIALSASNGANDAQKTIGIIALGLITTGYQQSFFVPLWVVLICAGAKGIGALLGGWRIIRMVGTRFYKIKPIHSFTSQLASAVVVTTASLMGGPVSTTQVVSMAVVGAGAGERLSKVRWLALKEVVLSWVLTIPITALLSALFFWVAKLFFH
ncbi:MAG: inorganic phosphate transporter, partial [Sediminibacterium sp.]